MSSRNDLEIDSAVHRPLGREGDVQLTDLGAGVHEFDARKVGAEHLQRHAQRVEPVLAANAIFVLVRSVELARDEAEAMRGMLAYELHEEIERMGAFCGHDAVEPDAVQAP